MSKVSIRTNGSFMEDAVNGNLTQEDVIWFFGVIGKGLMKNLRSKFWLCKTGRLLSGSMCCITFASVILSADLGKFTNLGKALKSNFYKFTTSAMW